MFFEQYQPARPKGMKRSVEVEGLRSLSYSIAPREFSLDPFGEFNAGDEVVFDTECYINYWLIAFKHRKSGKYFYLEKRRGEQLNTELLSRALWYFKLISFNGRYYDMPIVDLALQGASTEALKELSDEIIKEDKRPFRQERFNHVDLIEVAPLPNTSLKTYAGRIHAKRMQELPYPEWAELDEGMIDNTRDYCFNDCDNTDGLCGELKGSLQLRDALSEEYRQDLRSKSDAQIAEAVIVSELTELLGSTPKRPSLPNDFEFYYQAPSFVRFQTPAFQAALKTIESAPFGLDAAGSPQMPAAIAGLQLRLGRSVYRLGMGGLHSSEKSTAYRADELYSLIDRDVASYYPFIILNNSFYPKHLGEPFLEVYRTIVERRLRAKDRSKELKKAGDEAGSITWAITSDGLKITINGTFGKLGNMYSTIYSPDLLIQVTVTGQLCLLMLIEMIELAGIEVVSANTDGIVIKPLRSRENELNAIIAEWERITSFETEETRYKAIFSRDVNNYVAVKEDGECKVKGVYSEKGSALNSVLSKNPEYLICSDAVQRFLSKGEPVEKTIAECKDIRRFVAVRNVKGGAHKSGVYLGKVVRWYFAERTTGSIDYVRSGNRVPNTVGALPLMELGEFPDNIDHRWYVERAYRMIDDLGFYGNKSQQQALF